MASSELAFDKFSKWKNSKTVLKLTVVTNGGSPVIDVGWLAGVYDDSCEVAFVTGKMHDFRPIDFKDVSFVVSDKRVEATFGGDNFLTLEEMPVA